jgi:hypothetical protein
MVSFTLATPPDLHMAIADQLDRWAFLYGTARIMGAGLTPVPETDAALRTRLIRLAQNAPQG